MSQRIAMGLTAFSALFLVFDGAMKVVAPAFVVEANTPLGVPAHLLAGIGLTLLLCTATYLVPATRALGAVLLTGYLGGAVAIQLRAGAGWFEIVFPVLTASMVWGGILLRDPRVRALLVPWI